MSPLITAARERVELFLRRALFAQVFEFAVDLPRPPLRSVQWIKYLDSAGVVQTLDPATYTVDAVTVRFAAGYGDAPVEIPQAIRYGILIETANLYENREDAVVG